MKLKEKMFNDFAVNMLPPNRETARKAWLQCWKIVVSMAQHEVHVSDGVMYTGNTARNALIDALATLGEEEIMELADSPPDKYSMRAHRR